MTEKRLREIISHGKGITTEFKTAGFKLSSDIFETVAAFLNRHGGDLILGVKNDGTIEGVFADSVFQLKKDFVSGCNNQNVINPTYYLSVEEVDIAGKIVLYIRVPESSQVHKANTRILDRNEDGDFDITDNTKLVSELYIRKQSTYTENKIYEHIHLNDFKTDLFPQVRNLIKSQTPNHAWLSLNDTELMKSAGLWKKDYNSGNKCFTLASILLLGKEDVIASILPHYKTDAILRKVNLDRYDDRDDIRCNLFEARGRLMSFIEKHLPEKFYKEGTQRINLRDTIFHEIIGNLLVHREYTNPFPAKLIIEKEKVITENSNKPNGTGEIDLTDFSPFPKNPIIAKFFKQIGWAEELGSGIRNSAKYSAFYGNNKPQFFESDIFRATIPVPSYETVFSEIDGVKAEVEGVTPKTGDVKAEVEGVLNEIKRVINEKHFKQKTKETLIKIVIHLLNDPIQNTKQVAKFLNKSDKTIENYMQRLKALELIEYVGAPKKGGYKILDNNYKQGEIK